MKLSIKLIVPTLLLQLFLSGCNWEKEISLSGETMGTTYHIKLVAGYFNKGSAIKEKIENRLDEINQSMSTYLPNSEISRFNALQDTQQQLAVSDDFLAVMQLAKRIHEISEGAWDGTIQPLVKLWGFGSTQAVQKVPAQSQITEAVARIGFQTIHVSHKGYLQKKRPSVSLDLASIAKGYGVDAISALLKDLGLKNFLVEIGGEVMAAGYRKDGRRWRVGINQPSVNAGLTDVYKVVPLHNKAMATSGDYRSYFEVEGQRFSHILDPRTGYPVNNGIVSVSVIADNCAMADGMATAIMVMGRDRGMTLLNSLRDVEGLIIMRLSDNTLVHFASNGFDAH